MSSLVVLAFDTETGAEQMREDLLEMQKEHLIGLEDAAAAVRNKEGILIYCLLPSTKRAFEIPG